MRQLFQWQLEMHSSPCYTLKMKFFLQLDSWTYVGKSLDWTWMTNSFLCFQKSQGSEDYLLNASCTVCLSCFGKIDSVDFQALLYRHSPDCLVIYSHCRAIKPILLLQGRILQIQVFCVFLWSLHRSTSSQSAAPADTISERWTQRHYSERYAQVWWLWSVKASIHSIRTVWCSGCPSLIKVNVHVRDQGWVVKSQILLLLSRGAYWDCRGSCEDLRVEEQKSIQLRRLATCNDGTWLQCHTQVLNSLSYFCIVDIRMNLSGWVTNPRLEASLNYSP